MADGRDHREAARIAVEAGRLLVDIRQQMFEAGYNPWRIGDEGDRLAHDYIVEQLHDCFPDDSVLSEEGRDDLTRLDNQRVWIVDPLDGTREYGQYGRGDWAVHIALSEDGIATAGAVALPAMDQVLSTHEPPILPDREDGPPRLMVSRSHPSTAAVVVARALDGQMMALGSAGAKTAAVILGYGDIYAHSGGQFEWDNCAPAVVAQAAGMHVCRCDGSPMRFNYPDPWSPDFVMCRPEYAEAALEALAAVIRYR